jgi:hypothetical protein
MAPQEPTQWLTVSGGIGYIVGTEGVTRMLWGAAETFVHVAYNKWNLNPDFSFSMKIQRTTGYAMSTTDVAWAV